MSLATRAIADSNADVVSPVVESKNASRFPRAAEPNAHTTRANSSALISPAFARAPSHIVRHASAGSTHPHRVSVAPRSRARRATAPGFASGVVDVARSSIATNRGSATRRSRKATRSGFSGRGGVEGGNGTLG